LSGSKIKAPGFAGDTYYAISGLANFLDYLMELQKNFTARNSGTNNILTLIGRQLAMMLTS